MTEGQRLGLLVYTLGLGTEEEIESGDLRRLAGLVRRRAILSSART